MFAIISGIRKELVPEARWQMDREVLVSLLKSVVLANVMQVVTSDDDGPLHLHFGHHTFKKQKKAILDILKGDQDKDDNVLFVYFCHFIASAVP